MRVAAIYDIHGNLPALEAVVDEVQHADVDLVVVGGDVVPGPMPRECMVCLKNLGVPTRFIQGNGESDMLTQRAGGAIDHVPERFREVVWWSGEQLPDAHRGEIAKWDLTIELTIDGIGDVLFCHATPRNNTEIFTALTSINKLRPVLEGVRQNLVVCGHTHMQFDRTVDNVRIVNAGSVGMPFEEPGAYWLRLGPDVQLRRTTYDFEQAAKLIRSTPYPHADTFASSNILNPPNKTEMLESFASVELK